MGSVCVKNFGGIVLACHCFNNFHGDNKPLIVTVSCLLIFQRQKFPIFMLICMYKTAKLNNYTLKNFPLLYILSFL